MSIIRIIRAGDCPEIPWKNGGGTTREIAVFPPGAGMSDFDWRLSMAKVEQPGPFSAFPGIDRVLTVLEGALLLKGPSINVLLQSAGAPFAFDGNAEVAGHPINGPALDLNVMTRRGHYLGKVGRLKAGDQLLSTGRSFVLALEAQVLAGVSLDRLDCLEFDGSIAISGDALHVDIGADANSAPHTGI